MKFGPVALGEAEGAILAHSLQAGGRRLRKAHRLTAADIRDLRDAGVEEVIAAVLEPGDLDEDAAAARIAEILEAPGAEIRPPSTGRVNIHAADAGLFTVDKRTIDAINAVDPAVTVATLANFAPVEAGQMVATVKIIPFAVSAAIIARIEAAVAAARPFAIEPFRPHRVGLIQTVLPNVKESVLDKTARITADRLSRSASRVTEEDRPPHDPAKLVEAISAQVARNEMVLVFGASAVCDFDDVIPAAIRQAGGDVVRTGMPVDPGNLLVLGFIDGKPVIGAPGCARSPKLNGFDWVLDRLLSGLDISGDDIAGMGVGGLLMEIPTRPQPREKSAKPARKNPWIVLLAAGQSRRMGPSNKLLADFAGQPLVRRTAERAVSCNADGVVVVLGHETEAVSAALDGLAIKTAVNADYAHGLSTSLKAGIRALPPTASGALIMLADMPGITTGDLNRLVDAFAASGGAAIVRATHGGKRGNPVILPGVLFPEIERLEGDTGARHVVESAPVEIIDVELGAAASLDVDTPAALAAAGGALTGGEG